MQTLTIDLGIRSYPIYVGADLLAHKERLVPHITSKHVVIVTNETIAPLYLDQLKNTLSDYEIGQVILPDGEHWKNLDTLNQVFDYLMAHKCDRKTTLIALGGGVIGDMTGFAAACYRRGIPFIQVPTTLLAQVDSSVGGKTGVNHPLGKNMIGAFYQPACVLADISLLKTLPERQYSSGMAEVIKYGLICDESFYVWLERHIDQLMDRDAGLLATAVYRSCQNKAEVVAEDEREQGRRAILNLGHTFGHAIEAAQHYKGLLHGEAVAVGMMMAVDLSCRMGLLADTELQRLAHLLAKAKLPVLLPEGIERDVFIDLMHQDKKVQAGQLHLVLLKEAGQAFVTSQVDSVLFNATLDAFFE